MATWEGGGHWPRIRDVCEGILESCFVCTGLFCEGCPWQAGESAGTSVKGEVHLCCVLWPAVLAMYQFWEAVIPLLCLVVLPSSSPSPPIFPECTELISKLRVQCHTPMTHFLSQTNFQLQAEYWNTFICQHKIKNQECKCKHLNTGILQYFLHSSLHTIKWQFIYSTQWFSDCEECKPHCVPKILCLCLIK
jgi:hypothetical protein